MVVDAVDTIQNRSYRTCNFVELGTNLTGNFLCQWAVGLVPQSLDHLARVDTDRTAHRAEAVSSAGVHAGILVTSGKFSYFPGCAFRINAAADFPSAGDSLTRGEGQVSGRAGGFTEAALNTLVGNFVGCRQRFEILDMGFCILIQDDAGIEKIIRIEDILDLVHHNDAPGLLSKFEELVPVYRAPNENLSPGTEKPDKVEKYEP